MVLGKALQGMPPGYSENPHDYVNFYSKFDLQDIGDGSKESHDVLRSLAQRAFESNRKVLLGVHESGKLELAVAFPSGEESRYVFIRGHNCVRYQDLRFDDYEFLPSYNAIWSRNSDMVEVQVDWAHHGFLKYTGSGRDLSDGRLVVDHSSNAEIRFGWPSPVAQVLLGINDPVTDLHNVAMTLTLFKTNIESFDEAVAKLESIGNAFLFQVGLLDGDLVSLTKASSRDERLAFAEWDEP